MLVKEISDRWPGLNFRIAVARWLGQQGNQVQPLANELGLTPLDLHRWLDDRDPSQYVLGLCSDTIPALEKNKKNQKKKKREARDATQSDDIVHVKQTRASYLAEIKRYGAHEYANGLHERRREESLG